MTVEKLNLLRKTLFLLFSLIIVSMNSFAQFTNSGKNFFAAFGRNDNNAEISGSNVELMLRMTAVSDTKVTLHFTEGTVPDVDITIGGGEIRDYRLSPAEASTCYSGVQANASNKSVQITATEPITLVAINSADASLEAALILPVENLGVEYIHAGMDRFRTSDCNGYILVATEDDTRVTQYFSGLEPLTVALNKGQVYHYFNSSAGNTTGARFESDRPIACFLSGTQSLIGTRSNYTFEQLAPVNQWGTEFILPTNEMNAGFARIYPKKNKTTVRVKFTDHTENIYVINQPDAAHRYQDIIINGTGRSSATACYIVSDKPIGICTYHIPEDVNNVDQLSQPGVAWLPPLEQRTQSAVVTPLDVSGVHLSLKMDHYFLMIAPTASKDAATVSINGGDPLPVNLLSEDTFQWVADNIGGSGYSFGRYFFGESDGDASGPGMSLSTIARVDNPDGLILLAYGQGEFVNYFYTAGSAYRDLGRDVARNVSTTTLLRNK